MLPQNFLQRVIDQDVFLRNCSADTAKKRVLCKLDSSTCCMLKFLCKRSVLRREIDGNLIISREIQSFFDLSS